MKSSLFYNLVSFNAGLVAATNARRQDNGTSSTALFDFETIQLKTSDLAQLNASMQALFTFGNASSVDASSIASSRSACKVFPGDAEWPADDVWDIFNDLLGGALIKTIPIASSCYNDWNYNADKCAFVTDNWTNSTMHEEDPTSMMSPIYQGLTCMPTTDPTATCTLGAYPAYAVNATNVAQIQLAVNFARNTGIRFVVKNTGHEFSGKSGGAGALSVWTHWLQDIRYEGAEFTDADFPYTGPAFTSGSGVVGVDIMKAASEQGMVVVGGEARDVGVLGGYIQGGGHGPMTSVYGLAADQVISARIITADGRFVTASSTENTDLFWALRGGGPASWGVATSLTIKAYPTTPVTVVTFTFASGGNVTDDAFWLGVRAYWESFITFNNAGIYSYFFVFPPAAFGVDYFIMSPFWAPNHTQAETEALLAPWFGKLTALGIDFTPVYNTYDTLYEGWDASFAQETVGSDDAIVGSRLFLQEYLEDEATFNATFDAWSGSSRNNASLLVGFNINAPNVAGVDNAVLPAWRKTTLHTMQGTSWTDPTNFTTMASARAKLSELQLAWKAVTPGTGAYLGECDIEEVDWQHNFYGVNYDRLLSIKDATDPWSLFWTKTGVGSEVASVVSNDAIPDENGRLCWN
ncbi:putative fad binding domain protein [Botrytis fragariae]|uniref:Putative fad binding domain protein n=1 Tax=Botrytis fragariae TaxID=1964551 RepID=A0A8H6AR68_9HELO|nr:putative fad binding domain protein [Botrytis fragariae]KAF5872124.1 putative fad binding domain protein [Botrytis fragariae]